MLKNILSIIFLIFLSYQFLNSCTKPFENESKIQVKSSEIVYEIDNKVKIEEMTVSPLDDKLAIVKRESFFNLYSASSSIDSSDKLIKRRFTFFDGYIIGDQILAPEGKKIAYYSYKDGMIHIYEIETGTTSSFPIQTGVNFKQLKWASRGTVLNYVYYNSVDSSYYVCTLNIDTGINKQLTKQRIQIRNMAYSQPNSKLFFIGREYTNSKYKLYFTDTSTGILDSLDVTEYYFDINISNDGNRFCYIARDSLYNVYLNILNVSSYEFELHVDIDFYSYYSTCAWSSDDSKILLSGRSGYTIFDIISNSISYFRTKNSGNYSKYKVWGENNDSIFYLVEQEESDLFTFDVSSGYSDVQVNSIYNIENIDWSNDGTKLLYTINRKLWQMDLITKESELIPNSFEYVAKGIWNANDEWIAILHYQANSSLGFYNTITNDFFSIPTLDTFQIKDIEWSDDAQKLCVIGGDDYVKIFTWKNDTINFAGNIKLKADRIRWRPSNSEVINHGEYAAYVFNSEIGVFLIEPQTRFVQDGHASDRFKFDWSADGKSLYYLENYGIYKEQIFY